MDTKRMCKIYHFDFCKTLKVLYNLHISFQQQQQQQKVYFEYYWVGITEPSPALHNVQSKAEWVTGRAERRPGPNRTAVW